MDENKREMNGISNRQGFNVVKHIYSDDEGEIQQPCFEINALSSSTGYGSIFIETFDDLKRLYRTLQTAIKNFDDSIMDETKG